MSFGAQKPVMMFVLMSQEIEVCGKEKRKHVWLHYLS